MSPLLHGGSALSAAAAHRCAVGSGARCGDGRRDLETGASDRRQSGVSALLRLADTLCCQTGEPTPRSSSTGADYITSHRSRQRQRGLALWHPQPGRQLQPNVAFGGHTDRGRGHRYRSFGQNGVPLSVCDPVQLRRFASAGDPRSLAGELERGHTRCPLAAGLWWTRLP